MSTERWKHTLLIAYCFSENVDFRYNNGLAANTYEARPVFKVDC